MIVIEPEVQGEASGVTVEVPASSLAAAADAGLTLEVRTPFADIQIPPASLADLKASAGKAVISAAKTENGCISIRVSASARGAASLSAGIRATLPAAGGNVLVLVDGSGRESVIQKSMVSGNTVTALLEGSCTVKPASLGTGFADTEAGAWYESAVSFVSSHALFLGTSESTFSPEMKMDRAMLASVLCRLEGGTCPDRSPSFPDVEEDQWYSGGIRWAASEGIVAGREDGTFGVTDPVTRQDMAVMLFRYAEAFGVDTSASGDLGSFRDSASIADYAREALAWAAGTGLMQGSDGCMNPRDTASRAEVAAVMERLTGLILK